MAAEHRYGHTFYAGLASPGPAADYTLNSCFDGAAIKQGQKGANKKPTWGPPPTHESQKIARMRTDEVRFQGKHFVAELRGHFSPGPQYTLPGGIGGAPANGFAVDRKLQRDRLTQTGVGMDGTSRSTQYANTMPGEPQFNLTSGSFADPLRLSEPHVNGHAKDATYWRQSTMLQPHERHVSTPYSSYARRQEVTPGNMPWTEESRRGSCYGGDMQDKERDKLRSRSRAATAVPYRNLSDTLADPPLANIFGPMKSHSDFGQAPNSLTTKLGGLNRSWRESKVQGNNTTGTWFGPPPKSTGKLRYAFVQQMGVNSVPRSHPAADCDGGRITKYRVDRPGTAGSLFGTHSEGGFSDHDDHRLSPRELPSREMNAVRVIEPALGRISPDPGSPIRARHGV